MPHEMDHPHKFHQFIWDRLHRTFSSRWFQLRYSLMLFVVRCEEHTLWIIMERWNKIMLGRSYLTWWSRVPVWIFCSNSKDTFDTFAVSNGARSNQDFSWRFTYQTNHEHLHHMKGTVKWSSILDQTVVHLIDCSFKSRDTKLRTVVYRPGLKQKISMMMKILWNCLSNV